MTLRYRDLPVAVVPGLPQPQMACLDVDCDKSFQTFSAEGGDYFWACPDDPVTCPGCNGPMKLVVVETILRPL
jgi:hypothetical protein